MLGHAAVAQLVHVDALDGEALTGWGHPKPLADVSPPTRPHHRHFVTLGNHVLKRELRVDGRAQDTGPLPQALQALGLTRERVVLDVVGPSDRLQDVQASLGQNILVVATQQLFVLVFRHLLISPTY